MVKLRNYSPGEMEKLILEGTRRESTRGQTEGKRNCDQWEWPEQDLIHLFHSLVSVIFYVHAKGMMLSRNVSFNGQAAIKQIQPGNENWIFGLKNIQRASCSSAVSLCSRLFPGKSQQAARRHGGGDTPGTMRSQGWNVEFGSGEDGGSVFKSTGVGGGGEAWASQWTGGKPQRKQL